MMELKRLARLFRKPPLKVSDDHPKDLPEQLFRLSLAIDPGRGSLIFAAAELIELQAEQINRFKQAERYSAGRKNSMNEAQQTSDAAKYDELWMLTKFLFSTLADIEELLDPRSRTPLQDSQTARSKTLDAIRVARKSGVIS